MASAVRRRNQSSSAVAPEKRRLKLGYIPLADAAPLIAALERGYFRAEGLDVTLSAEPSWANIRDKIQLGSLDAAQMLAPMPLASTMGIDGRATPVLSALTLNLNGNAITVSNRLYERMAERAPDALAEQPTSARALATVIADRQRGGEAPLRLATVYPFATHNYQLRYWLSSAGIDPDKDVQLRVVPPPLVATHLEAGWIDGYCVGEPWNSVAVDNGLGHTLITSYELWNNGQEKVLGVTSEWAEQFPNTHRALLRAVLRACRWLDHSSNRPEAARLLADGGYIEAPAGTLERGLTGAFEYSPEKRRRTIEDMLVFHRYAANFPWRSHTLWYASQMARWGHLPEGIDLTTMVHQCVRPDLFRQAAGDIGLASPTEDMKTEGEHERDWLLETDGAVIPMGKDAFFDRMRFDPENLADYLAGLPVSGARAATG
jgi:nitrate/nitrite transport system substrate-binding protein